MSQKVSIDRRRFLKYSTIGIVGAGMLGAENPPAVPPAVPPVPVEPVKEALKIKAFRTLGRTGFKVSDIGSGGPQDVGVLNALLDAGVNYIDTAENYGNGASETVTGNVIKNRDRKSIFISTKLGMGKKTDNTKEGLIARTNKCLERLQTPYVDCLMIHSPAKVEDLKNEAFHEAVKQLKAEGKIKFVGLSNHGGQWQDDGDPMEKVLLAAAEDGRFDVMLIVYNFVQTEAGEKVIDACRRNNIGVTLMKTNPVGLYLEFQQNIDNLKKEGKEIPAFYQGMMPRLKATVDKAETFIQKYQLKNPNEIRDAAVKFVLQNPGVHSVCCSFQNFDDVNAFLNLSGSTLSATEIGKLTAYKEGLGSLYCRHACGQCEEKCPEKVPVNTIMRYNHYFEAQGRQKYALEKYAHLSTNRADRCLDCQGFCQTACPYGVPIHGLLAMAHRRLTLA